MPLLRAFHMKMKNYWNIQRTRNFRCGFDLSLERHFGNSIQGLKFNQSLKSGSSLGWTQRPCCLNWMNWACSWDRCQSSFLECLGPSEKSVSIVEFHSGSRTQTCRFLVGLDTAGRQKCSERCIASCGCRVAATGSSGLRMDWTRIFVR